MATPVGRGWALEELDTSEQAVVAVGTETRPARQEIKERFTVRSVSGFRLGERPGLTESGAAAGEKLGPVAVSQKAVVTDADEAFGEDVEEETATELAEGKGEGPGSSATVVLVAKGDGLVIDGQEPMVRDRDAVGVAGQILEHVVGGLEGRLGVDDPLGAQGFLEKAAEGR